uniref:Putative secreted protein n=1 Tax=Ixodes ricinus TaxID=34613 RepID=A0A6B0U8S8_IXORI
MARVAGCLLLIQYFFYFGGLDLFVVSVCLVSCFVWGSVAASYTVLKRPLESSSTSSTSVDWKRPRGAL